MIRIHDLSIPELALYNLRNEAALMHYYEPEAGLFLAESAKVAERALAAGYRPESCLIEDEILRSSFTDFPCFKKLLAEEADREGQPVPVYVAGHEVMEKITGYHLTGGVLCAMRRKPLIPAEKILIGAGRIAVLEGVTNPTNVGAIVRSAAAMGLDAVLFTGGCADPLYRRAIRVSMGCIFQIPWTIADSADDLAALLLKSGYVTAALSLKEDSIDIDDPRLKESKALALYLGNEGHGLPKERIASCDYSVKIPMCHGVDSLNVAAASAVAFWECRKRR